MQVTVPVFRSAIVVSSTPAPPSVPANDPLSALAEHDVTVAGAELEGDEEVGDDEEVGEDGVATEVVGRFDELGADPLAVFEWLTVDEQAAASTPARTSSPTARTIVRARCRTIRPPR
ncbi:MAG: hypothetical protein M0Z82_05370 [Actinomycetota bacterium]|nr:hypothetical protein [Actinomycetota bacterium]